MDDEIAAQESIIQVFRSRVAEAVAEAYSALFRLGLSDEQIVALLGLPSGTLHPADIPAMEAAPTAA